MIQNPILLTHSWSRCEKNVENRILALGESIDSCEKEISAFEECGITLSVVMSLKPEQAKEKNKDKTTII